MNDLLDRLRAAWSGLAPRERVLVSIAGGLVVMFLVWLAVLRPVSSGLEGSDARAALLEQQLEEAVRLRRELDTVRGRLEGVERRIRSAPGADIFTTLERLARQSAVKVDSMEPQASPASDRYRETKVQVVLKGVTLAQLVSYLNRIESAPEPLSIKSLRIRTRPDKPELLDVTFTVSSFEPV